ncbi:putative disease resistance RPP13-like protein 3 isoform X2 [Panicum miliaceum]|uniref:Disease resistance RPP13-like protein 3 isoform X2 n=1 Tax=Panicum miliaceum TaxID=4540 RepID=A0A3L6Q0E8_PANMI|nr:putative disease resistance RPP13-like protein 3 isoform X2 [Panicum miliaceum]
MRIFFKGLLYELGKNVNDETLDERQLIDQVRKFLQMKRYCIVIDDIWSVSIWDMIRCALPDSIGGYIIITTTRILKIAEQVGGAYKMKPLCLDSSRKLLYRRIFGNDEKYKCPDEHLAEVSDRILKKCAGVPLAMITIASLLANRGRDKMEWYEVCNSIGTELEYGLDIENMRKILAYSYYDLSSHLRTCLLYLSVFPEDFIINKGRLIRMWIGEGFIQCEKQGKSLFELGEFYFNELVNTSMIQPIQDSFGRLSSCRIHDMVLDLIRSLSSEENFVTVLSDMDSTSPSNMIRRLSLQNSKKTHVMDQTTRSLLQHARSTRVPNGIGNLTCLEDLLVLDIDGSSINNIEELSQLTELRRYCIVIDDIWSVSIWDMIRCALPDSIGGYIIITTTRILKIAEQVGGAYKMKPLCLDSSRKLLYRRIFGNDEKYKWADEHLAEVYDRILKKCAGVPLAIITIASLLANRGRNKMEWYEEDYAIEKFRLIWMWIAEGFVQHKEQGKGLYEIGECYFNELINKSLIQPVYDRHDAIIEFCRVHDMVLDLVCSILSEENFVTMLNNEHNTSPAKKVRRLLLQSNMADHAIPCATMSLLQVRSVVAFSLPSNLMPALGSFRVLRVLDLKSCHLPQGCDLKHLGNLLHLRYLRVGRTYSTELPDDVGNLRYLQTLDLVGTRFDSLPSTVVQLRHLMCLCIDQNTRVPNGIRSLTSLEDLSTLNICDSTNVTEELCHLTELRTLEIFLFPAGKETLGKSLVMSLCKLQKVQSLTIWATGGECNFDAWVAPRHLRRLQL